MYTKLDEKHKVIDFFTNDNMWVECLSYDQTTLFIVEVTKILSEVKK